MATTYSVSKASPSDAHAIASIFAHSWASPFTRLQFGHVDPSALANAMAPGIVSQMQNPLVDFRVIRDLSDSELVVAAAQWKLPEEDEIGEEEDSETMEEKEERRQFEDDAYRNKLPDDSNKDLIMEFTVGLRGLRGRTLEGRKHYLLENIATRPDHRGKGLASQLIRWVFPLADVRGVEVYLDTASDNQAMRLYKRLGFEEGGSNTIEDLSRFGGEGSETHVALIRKPISGDIL